MSGVRARPWTSHEDIVLQRLAMAEKYAAAIAAEMNRSESAIRNRAKKLNITLARAQGRAEGEEMTFATHPERQFMEYLRGKGWVKGTTLPASRFTSSLQKRGWIEQQAQGPKNEIFYRMTDVGLKALMAPVSAGRPSKAKGK